MSAVIDDFMTNVDKAYASEGHSVEMYDLYQALTLDTICGVAMGVDFQVQKDIANSKLLKRVKAMATARLTFFLLPFRKFV